MRTFLLAAALFIAAPALAQSAGSSATLADAASAPSGRVIVDGAAWRCEGTACTATGGTNQPATRACRRANAKLGDVTAFTYRGVSLTAEQIAVCNA